MDNGIWVLVIGENKHFLDHAQAQMLKAAIKGGNRGMVVFDELVVNIPFIKEFYQASEGEDLDSNDLKLCEQVAEWVSRDIHGLEWSYDEALRYSKKLMKRIGYEEVKKLWNIYANGYIPSVKKFLSEAKQISNLDQPMDISRLLETGDL